MIDVHIDNVPLVIMACCVLHNVCEVHGDTFNDEWLQDSSPEDSTTSEPDIDATDEHSNSGTMIQNALVEYLSS